MLKQGFDCLCCLGGVLLSDMAGTLASRCLEFSCTIAADAKLALRDLPAPSLLQRGRRRAAARCLVLLRCAPSSSASTNCVQWFPGRAPPVDRCAGTTPRRMRLLPPRNWPGRCDEAFAAGE